MKLFLYIYIMTYLVFVVGVTKLNVVHKIRACAADNMVYIPYILLIVVYHILYVVVYIIIYYYFKINYLIINN